MRTLGAGGPHRTTSLYAWSRVRRHRRRSRCRGEPGRCRVAGHLAVRLRMRHLRGVPRRARAGVQLPATARLHVRRLVRGVCADPQCRLQRRERSYDIDPAGGAPRMPVRHVVPRAGRPRPAASRRDGRGAGMRWCRIVRCHDRRCAGRSGAGGGRGAGGALARAEQVARNSRSTSRHSRMTRSSLRSGKRPVGNQRSRSKRSDVRRRLRSASALGQWRPTRSDRTARHRPCCGRCAMSSRVS